MKELGTKLRDARKAAGLYQEGTCTACRGVSVDTVRRWESGAREPRASDLQSLAGVLGPDVVAALFAKV